MENHFNNEQLNKVNRTYFIDAKRGRNESFYVTITENKKTEYGFEKHKIKVSEEHIDELINSLNEVNQKIKIVSQVNENKNYLVQRPIINYTIIDANWTKEEDSALEVLYRKGKTIAELMTLFNRDEKEIASQIDELKLKLK